MPTQTIQRAVARAALACAFVLLGHASTPLYAQSLLPQQVFATFGYSSGAFVAIYGAGASWDLKARPPARDESGLGIRLDRKSRIGWARESRPEHARVGFQRDAGLSLDVRQARNAALFVEGGLGVHLLSATRINNDRIFSTAFQFGEMVGIGTCVRSAKRVRSSRVTYSTCRTRASRFPTGASLIPASHSATRFRSSDCDRTKRQHADGREVDAVGDHGEFVVLAPRARDVEHRQVVLGRREPT